MAIHQREWLHLAKAIPIGGTARHPHTGDRTTRPNLVVSNHADRWACYCQSCKAGGVVMKEHVRVTGIAPPKLSTAPTLPLDMVLIRDLPLPLQKAVVGFLMRKNMDLIHFDQDLYYSDSRKRIMVPTAQGWIGRDTTENSPQKWLMYGNVPYLGEVRQGGTAVLVEDAFSWFKLKWSIKNDERFRFTDPICTLGTNARDSLFLVLVQRSVASLWFYDGDSAGIKGAGKGAARLTVFGVHSTPATAPSGLDPKDMSAEGIRQHLLTHLYGGELGCEHSSSPE